MEITIEEAIKQMLQIVHQLRQAYPIKKFTLDGRLVGDMGEVIVERVYKIELYSGIHKYHDAKCLDGRLVQIKATMQKSLTFPCDHIPDYYLGIQIHPDGTFEEIFNGPGIIAHKAVKDRKRTKTNLHTVSTQSLISLNKEVQLNDRIPRRGRILE